MDLTPPPDPSITAQKKSAYCDQLAAGHTVRQAARAAGIDIKTAYIWRAADPDFAADWLQALENMTDLVERAAFVRAVDGYEEPIIHRGQVVGTRRVYSDALAALILKGRRQAIYRDRAAVEVTTLTLADLVAVSFQTPADRASPALGVGLGVETDTPKNIE